MESSCAGFFAQACPNSFARFEAILATSEAPPSPPPPPFPPLGDNFPGGLSFVLPKDLLNEDDASQAATRRRQLSLVHSYDATSTTVIVSHSNWLGWDFGTSVDDLYAVEIYLADYFSCLLYTSPSPRDRTRSRMPSSA